MTLETTAAVTTAILLVSRLEGVETTHLTHPGTPREVCRILNTGKLLIYPQPYGSRVLRQWAMLLPGCPQVSVSDMPCQVNFSPRMYDVLFAHADGMLPEGVMARLQMRWGRYTALVAQMAAILEIHGNWVAVLKQSALMGLLDPHGFEHLYAPDEPRWWYFNQPWLGEGE